MAEHAPRSDTALQLMRWIGWAQRAAAEDWVRDRGLTQEQSFVLGYLTQNPGAVQREIAETTRTSAASVTSLLQGLERRHLVRRGPDPSNARVKRVWATPEGSDLVAGFGDAMTALDDTFLAPLTADERDTLTTLLRKVTAELDEPTR